MEDRLDEQMALTGTLKEAAQHKIDRVGAREPKLIPPTAGPESKRQVMQETAGAWREKGGKMER